MTFLTALASLPMGDDTPILLYCILGLLGVALVIAMIVMGKKSRQDDDKDRK